MCLELGRSAPSGTKVAGITICSFSLVRGSTKGQ
jgi:hypothetical protein